MAVLTEVVEDVGRRLNLRGRADDRVVYGERDGYLVQVESEVRGNIESVVVTIRCSGPQERRTSVIAAIRGAAEVTTAGIRPERLQAAGGTVVYIHRPSSERSSAETITREVEVLLGAVKRFAVPVLRACRMCGDPAGDPVLLRGVIDRVCPACWELEEALHAASPVDRPDDAWVIDVWKRRYRLRALLFSLLAVGGVLAVVLTRPDESAPAFYAIVAIMIVATLWIMLRFGCPKCGWDPSMRVNVNVIFNPEFCSHCGVRLRPSRSTPKAEQKHSQVDDSRTVASFRRRRAARASTAVILVIAEVLMLAVGTGAVPWQPWFGYIPVVSTGVLVWWILVWIWSLFCPNCRGLVYSSVPGDLTPARCPKCGARLK